MGMRYLVVGAVQRTYADTGTGEERSFNAINVLAAAAGEGEFGYLGDQLRCPAAVAREIGEHIAKHGPCYCEVEGQMRRFGRSQSFNVVSVKRLADPVKLSA